METFTIAVLSGFGGIILILIILSLISKSKGKVTLTLDKYQFSPGEAVTGKVVLKLKKPVEAKSLKVGIHAKKRATTRTRDSSGKITKSTEEKRFFDLDIPIAGEGSYPAGEREVPFSITIPTEPFKKKQIGGFLGKVIPGLEILSGYSETISWYVTARLEISGMDMGDEVQISIISTN